MGKRGQLEVSKTDRDARRRAREEDRRRTQAGMLVLFERLSADLDDNVYSCFMNDRSEACLEGHPIGEPDIGFHITSDGIEGEAIHMISTFNHFLTFHLTDSYDGTDEGASVEEMTQEVEEVLRRFLAVGRAYLIQRPVPTGRYFPKITVEMPEREEVMRHPLNDDLARLISFRWLSTSQSR